MITYNNNIIIIIIKHNHAFLHGTASMVHAVYYEQLNRVKRVEIGSIIIIMHART